MIHYLTRRQCREIDRIAIEEYGIPSIVLMENAAHGVCSFAMQAIGLEKRDVDVTILCGKGNNGGDGLAVARLLSIFPRRLRVLLTDPPEAFSGDAAMQLRIVQKMGLLLEDADSFLISGRPIDGLLIDAVYGTGFRTPSRIDFRRINDRVRQGKGRVVAIDVPSGMDADTGKVEDDNAIEAGWTVSMETYKAAFRVPGAERFHGSVWTVSLGIPWAITERAAASPP